VVNVALPFLRDLRCSMTDWIGRSLGEVLMYEVKDKKRFEESMVDFEEHLREVVVRDVKVDRNQRVWSEGIWCFDIE
jgi:hypothetical protein